MKLPQRRFSTTEQSHEVRREVIDAIAADARPPARPRPLLAQIGSSLGNERAFWRAFLAHPEQVGSIVPSSGFLEQRIVRAADLARARCVVELGPGTGGTTRALLRALPPHARLLAIELSPFLHARLVARLADPRLILQLGSAEQLAELLQTWRLPAPDAVVSGIPFSTMPATVAGHIAATLAKCLAPGGRFVAYQVRARVAEVVAPYLGAPAVSWEWLNVPPLRVFRWTKPLDQEPVAQRSPMT
jgi:phospholipid N-methyltransferase